MIHCIDTYYNRIISAAVCAKATNMLNIWKSISKYKSLTSLSVISEEEENVLLQKPNPEVFNLSDKKSRFFIIRTYSLDDVQRSIKYGIWCTSRNGHVILDKAYHKQVKKLRGKIYLFFTINGSDNFCGMAKMISPVDFRIKSYVWSKTEWRGLFQVNWIYVKDVSNDNLRHIKLENNKNISIHKAGNAQELVYKQGIKVLEIFENYPVKSCIVDDYQFYEKREEDYNKRHLEWVSEQAPKECLAASKTKYSKKRTIINKFNQKNNWFEKY